MESNKENQDAAAAAASTSVASPRVSSVGAPSEGADHPPPQPQPQAYQATVFSDHLHWGGVQRTLHARSDARSVSSAAADRDAQSVYDDVQGLDAHTEGDEHDEDDDGEITLTQVQGELRELPQLRHEPSAVESAFTGISAAGSLADVVDQLADQAVAGELSPRQAAAAIRSATAAREGLEGGSADDGSAGGAGGSSAAAAVDALDGSESVASLPHRSSIAPSDDGWHGASGLGGSSTADMMDSIPLEAEAPPAETLPVEAPAAAGAPPAEQAGDAAQPAAAAGETAAAEAAAEPAAAEDEAGEPQPQEQQEEESAQQSEAEEEPALPESKSAHDVAAVLDAPEVPAVAEEPSTTAAAADEAAGQDSGNATAVGSSAAAAAAAAAAAGVARKPSGSAYRSRLMQQLTASGSEDDITVYSSADIAGASGAAGQDPLSQAAAAQQAQQQPSAAADAAVPPAAGGRGGMQPLSIANGSGSSAADGVMPTQDTAKALAAINAAASNAPAGEGGEAAAQSSPELLFPPQWYQTFKGLLYMDGVDSLGRPVVVLNADAVPANMKASALVFVKAHLEPLVNQGDYVLVFTSRGHARLPSMWIMGAYRSLPRPFRKNVQHIVLVRPSAFLRTVLAFMRPFVSKKAHRKIKQVQSVHDIAAATEGEVTLASLGPAFSAELLAAEQEAAAAAAQAAGGGVAPAAGGSAGSSP